MPLAEPGPSSFVLSWTKGFDTLPWNLDTWVIRMPIIFDAILEGGNKCTTLIFSDGKGGNV